MKPTSAAFALKAQYHVGVVFSAHLQVRQSCTMRSAEGIVQAYIRSECRSQGQHMVLRFGCYLLHRRTQLDSVQYNRKKTEVCAWGRALRVLNSTHSVSEQKVTVRRRCMYMGHFRVRTQVCSGRGEERARGNICIRPQNTAQAKTPAEHSEH
jgi:hypothetical protein